MIDSEFARTSGEENVSVMEGCLCAQKNSSPMTPDRIYEEIQWLKDDVASCKHVIQSPESSLAEKAECRQRVLANRREIVHLETTLTMIKEDPLF